jgi:glycerophosphoryl diester phosphodiesterase
MNTPKARAASEPVGLAQHTGWPYPRWIAHRGAGKLAPENTLAAFELGASHGFRMFECDVKLSADAVPFLLHDADLDRTTSGHGRAGDMPWAELSHLDAGAWHSNAYRGERLLSLEALAHCLLAKQLLVNLEIKPTPGDEERTGRVVAQCVAAWWAQASAWPLLSSFQPLALQAARTQAPQLPRALLLDQWRDSCLQEAQELGCVAVVPRHALLDAGVIAQAHEVGLRVLTYTVNEAERAQQLLQAGLDGLITDRVDLFEPEARGEATGATHG